MRRKSYTKNGVRIVRFPGGRVARFHQPGTVAYAKGVAKRRAAGKRLAKIYGFAKKRRSTRRTVKSNPKRCNPRVSKTELIYVTQMYTPSYGWEDVTASTTRKEAREDIKAYRENQRGAFRLIRRRVKKETNPRRKTKARRNPSDAFNVYLGRKLIDTVFASKGSHGVTAAEMKYSLVNHDGYDYRITVKKARK